MSDETMSQTIKSKPGFYDVLTHGLIHGLISFFQNEIRDAVFSKRRKLRQAFSILKIERNGEEIISRHIWNAIISRVLPKKSSSQIELLMTILDANGKGYISKKF